MCYDESRQLQLRAIPPQPLRSGVAEVKASTVLVSVVLFLLGANPAQAQIARLVLQSPPGEWVGGGTNHDITYTPENALISAWVMQVTPAGDPAQVLFMLGSLGQIPIPGAALTFGAPGVGPSDFNQPLVPGTYENVLSTMDNIHGVFVTMDGRGCREARGSFTVTDFSWSRTPFGEWQVDSFAGSFIQYCDALPQPLTGSFTFQAVPEPSVTVLIMLACLTGLVQLARGRRPWRAMP